MGDTGPGTHAKTRDIAESERVDSLIRQEIRRHTQQGIAEAMNVGDSTVSRWLSGETGIPLDKIGSLLFALGLKVVHEGDGFELVDSREVDALLHFARREIDAQIRRRAARG